MATFASHRKLSDNSYIEIAGVEYDDFEEGDIFEHRPGRTLTADENRLHTMRAADLSPRVVDAVYNENVYGGQQVIGETFVLSVVTALTTKTFNKVVANLGWKNIEFPTPVMAGDTIYAESEVLGKRESQSRPTQGVLHIRTRAVNQRGEEVCRFERRLLIYKRGLGPYEAAGY
ncbi:MAG: MaoC family dehydratase [Deltaproteobacteria bacterium]|nr:MaoC family dehydratase [Deltaproteobacteria bacterium]